MSWSGCEESTWWITWALRQEETHAAVAAALRDGEPVTRVIQHLVGGLEPRIAGTVREELEALPGATVLAIIEAWRLADLGCKPFELSSARPERPLEAARKRRVRLVVDVDEDGVRAEISHVVTRHPTWQVSASAVQAVGPN
jgi:hypothetical protein